MAKKSVFEQKITAELKNKSLLITGGAGSIVSALTKKILEYPVKSVRILDINEHSLFKLKRDLNDKRVRYLLGNILNRDRVEMAGSIAEIAFNTIRKEFDNFNSEDPNVYLIEASKGVLPMFSDKLSQKAEKYLKDFGVTVLKNEKVENIDESTVYTNKRIIKSNNIIWAAGNKASTLIAKLNTNTDESGRAIVDSFCSLIDDRDVYVIGDAAHYKDTNNQPLPGIAPVAIQQGKYVSNIIRNNNKRNKNKPFKFSDKGMLATVGKYKAIGKIGNLEISGITAWLFWSVIHIVYLIGYRLKLLVIIEWIFSYLFNKKGTRLIYREEN